MSNTKIGLINLTTVTLNQINFKSITYSFQKLTLDCSYTKSCSKTTHKKNRFCIYFLLQCHFGPIVMEWCACSIDCLAIILLGLFLHFLNNILYEVCILLIVLSSIIIIIIMEMWNSYTVDMTRLKYTKICL